MNAGKSIELIKVAYNYEERGQTCSDADSVQSTTDTGQGL